MSKAKLMAALENFYSGYCVRVDAEKLLDTKVEIGGKTSTVAKIARKENFTAEETAAFVIVVESFDVDEAVEIVKNHEYRLFPDAHDDYTLGEALFWELRHEEKSLPPYLTEICINFENLGWVYRTNITGSYFTDYGFVEIF